MPTALKHTFTVPGIVLQFPTPTRDLKEVTTKFWGVRGESRITGGLSGRTLEIPVLVYGEQFNTQAKLSNWFEKLIQYQGFASTLVVTSDADRPPYEDCSFDYAIMLEPPKIDEAGSLGGGAFAPIVFIFRQHT